MSFLHRATVCQLKHIWKRRDLVGSASFLTQPCRLLSSSSVVPFKLADIGEGIAEVELMKWFVKEGDTIKAFDRLCEVQSDKATVEITSRYNGKIVKVHHDEGAIVKVGSALVDIETGTANKSGATSVIETPTTPASIPNLVESTPAQGSEEIHRHRVQTTPAVRKLAKENHIDLALIPGTGPKGRVLKEDVLNYIANKGSSSPVASSGAHHSHHNHHHENRHHHHIPEAFAHEMVAEGASSKSGINSHIKPSREDRVVPVRGVQRLMVKSMNAANQIKHLTLGEEMSFDGMIHFRKKLKAVGAKKGVKLSYMPLMIKAASLALDEVPAVNATVNEAASEITLHGHHHIGVAMDTPKGLIVPVIHFVDQKSIWEIAQELSSLQESASKGALTEAQLQGGTFTLSNIGSIGGTYAVPVLVVPQVAIGAMGRVMTLPRYVNKDGELATLDQIEDGLAEVKPMSTINLSWSADHRVVDGATIARFSNSFKKYLENPEYMLAELR